MIRQAISPRLAISILPKRLTGFDLAGSDPKRASGHACADFDSAVFDVPGSVPISLQMIRG
jgi:hypothetical protein